MISATCDGRSRRSVDQMAITRKPAAANAACLRSSSTRSSAAPWKRTLWISMIKRCSGNAKSARPMNLPSSSTTTNWLIGVGRSAARSKSSKAVSVRVSGTAVSKRRSRTRRISTVPGRRGPKRSSWASSTGIDVRPRRSASSSVMRSKDSSPSTARSITVRVGDVVGIAETNRSSEFASHRDSCQMTPSRWCRRRCRSAVTSTGGASTPARCQRNAALRCDATAGPARHAASTCCSHDDGVPANR